MTNSIRYLLLLGFLFSFIIPSAQRLSEKRLKEMDKLLAEVVLLNRDPDFETRGLKNPYTNESSVLLAHKTSFDFDTRKEHKALKALITIQSLGTANLLKHKNILVRERERRKILLQDNFSVDKYSILYFRLDEEDDLFDARVIKKNGVINKVTLSDAIKVGSFYEVPNDFLGYTDGPPSQKYPPIFYKVPIPDLEVGDIIEYEFQHLNTQYYVAGKFSEDDFNPVYYLCERDVPVLRQVIEVTTVDDFYMGYRSLRGAPGFTETEENGKRKYRWTDVSRQGINGLSYSNPLTTLPSVKFQIVFAKKRAQDLLWFNNNGESNKSISVKDLASKALNYWNRVDQTDDNSQGYSLLNHPNLHVFHTKQLKKLGIIELPEDEFIKSAYYYLRGKTLWKDWTDYDFAKSYSFILSKRSIPHEVIITTNKKISFVSDIAFEEELVWGIRVKGQYYFNPGKHLNPGEIPYYAEGNQSGIFNIIDSKAGGTPSVHMLPIMDTSQNKYVVNLSAEPNVLKASLKIQKDVELTGLSKQSQIEELLDLTPFAETDLRNYGGVELWGDGMFKSEAAKMYEEWDFQKKKWKEEKPEFMKNQIEFTYDKPVLDYGQIKFTQDGRNHKKTSLIYNESFELGEMISTVGEDLVIELPLLIEQQKQIKREERVRIYDIDAGYARTNIWNVNCIIPPGYQVVETGNMKQEVKNSAGRFSSTYQIKGNVLTIQVIKQYYKGNLPVNLWEQMTSFLDAAYSFSISKIVMKKVK